LEELDSLKSADGNECDAAAVIEEEMKFPELWRPARRIDLAVDIVCGVDIALVVYGGEAARHAQVDQWPWSPL
jgi:hypothetical protein